MRLHFMAIAAPSHPLHKLNRTVTQRDLKRHRQLVTRDSGVRRHRNAGWLGAGTLRLAALLREIVADHTTTTT